jgi:hypothetical protein
VRAALPGHRTGASEAGHPALAILHDAFQKSVRETISLDGLLDAGIVEALRNGLDAGEIGRYAPGPLGYTQCRFWRAPQSLNYLVGQSV